MELEIKHNDNKHMVTLTVDNSGRFVLKNRLLFDDGCVDSSEANYYYDSQFLELLDYVYKKYNGYQSKEYSRAWRVSRDETSPSKF